MMPCRPPRTASAMTAPRQGSPAGIDLSATLQSGQLQWQSGLLAQADGAWLLMPMAERAPRALLARLTQTMDNRQISDPRGHTLACHSTLFAVDESDPDEAVLHTSVAQRLAFWIQLDGLSLKHAHALTPLSGPQVEQARLCLQQMQADPGALRALMEVAQSLGIVDARALRFAWRLAQVHAALRGARTLAEEDLTRAIRAVLVPRATRWPQASEEAAADQPPESAEPPPDAPEAEDPGEGQGEPLPPPEMLLAASLASLPPDVLDRMLWQAQASRSASAQGHSGELRRNSQRGRPLPSRPGRPGDQARLDVLATLRHAAPRQRLRSQPLHNDAQGRVLLRAED